MARLVGELEELRKEMEGQNFYEILGVEPSATKEEIRRAYQKLTKKYHPDRYPGKSFPREVSALITDIFTHITDAYNILLDDEQRKLFDKRIQVYEEYEFHRAYQDARKAMRKGDFSTAAKCFKRVLEKEPAHKESQIDLTWCRYKLSQDARAAKASFKELLEVFPDEGQIYYYLGLVYKAEGKEPQARGCFQKATDLSPNHVEALRELRLMRMRAEKDATGKSKEDSSFFARLFKRKKNPPSRGG
ncbi:MAG: tetratricopeptide repeat protein [Deltaproteobacteria bacterium]|nr:MAG: tetratricopeptide repeat protein [Deltaproteobacteria bacterium]